jgi:hypothetical protein
VPLAARAAVSRVVLAAAPLVARAPASRVVLAAV